MMAINLHFPGVDMEGVINQVISLLKPISPGEYQGILVTNKYYQVHAFNLQLAVITHTSHSQTWLLTVRHIFLLLTDTLLTFCAL